MTSNTKWYQFSNRRNQIKREVDMYVKSSPPRPILQNIYTSTIMPFGKLSTTLPTRMLDILKRGHQVRDTSETATEAENSSPATVTKKKKKGQPPNPIFQLFRESNLLRSPTTNSFNTRHLPFSTNRTINRARCRLYTVQRYNGGISTRMARRRVVLLRVTLELCLRLRLCL